MLLVHAGQIDEAVSASENCTAMVSFWSARPPCPPFVKTIELTVGAVVSNCVDTLSWYEPVGSALPNTSVARTLTKYEPSGGAETGYDHYVVVAPGDATTAATITSEGDVNPWPSQYRPVPLL